MPFWITHEDISDYDKTVENTVYIMVDGSGPVWRATINPEGVLRAAPLSNIKGAIPTICNLARARPPKRTPCAPILAPPKSVIDGARELFCRHLSCELSLPNLSWA